MAKKYEQTDVAGIEAILNRILDLNVSPVARCRLLSSGFAPYHMLDVGADLEGTRACLGCGNCIDACGLLAREPGRLEATAQRTSMALEHMVGEDCDRCFNCALSCPQVDTTIKHYIVNRHMIEALSRLETRIGDEQEPDLDLYIEEALT